MLMRRITIAVPDSVAQRLDRVAHDQFRDRKQQAAILLMDGLERAERKAAREARTEAVR